MKFIYVLYNKNNPDLEDIYSNDLFDLFGSPDGTVKGFIYSMEKGKHKKLRWDWGISGFKNLVMALFYESNGSLTGFDKFYERVKRNEIILSEIYQFPIKAVYQVKPKNNNSVLFPAFILDIHEISKEGNRIFLTFSPNSYFIIDPENWKNYLESRDEIANWVELTTDENIINALLKSPSQSQHRIYPKASFLRMVSLLDISTLFFKKIDLSDRKRHQRDIGDNQIFWSMYQFFTAQTQVAGDALFRYGGRSYEVKSIPSNTLSKANAVYKQEIGSLQAIYSALANVFEDDFIRKEFKNKDSIHINQSQFIKRAYSINHFKHYNKQYSTTDYDYVIDLSPVGINKRVCFDLTVGLWEKGRGKTIDEYLSLWKHNIIEMPQQNSEIITIFAFGHNLNKDLFFAKNRYFDSYNDFLSQLTNHKSFIIDFSESSNIDKNTKTVILPFFGKEFINELNNLMSANPRKSLMYKAVERPLSIIKTT